MATSYLEIYTRAMSMLKSPLLSRLQENGFQDFTGDGTTLVFPLTDLPLTTNDVIFEVKIDDIVVNGYKYDELANSIVFDIAPILDANIEVTWLIVGAFVSITNEDITLLSLATCLAWALQIQNDELDIDRSLNDTGDFRQHANATTTTAKFNWVKHFEELYHRALSKADWRPTLRRRRWCNNMNTIYGNIDKVSIKIYNESLKSRTFALLYLYEEQPFETYQRHLQDLISGVISFEKIKLQKNKHFCKYIELLTAILEPNPISETKHSFVRRHILDATSLLNKMFKEVLDSEVDDGNK